VKIQINPTSTQEIKSFKSVRYINQEDLEYQLSIVKLGMKYNRMQQKNVRSNKEYDELLKTYSILYDLWRSISRTLENLLIDKIEKLRKELGV
tara:strand:- start:384 stop:662 length:279 start_codon:yes stop_codon:yes gene_type:complete